MGVSFDVMELGKARLFDPQEMGYRDSLDIIKDESVKIQKSFVKIGWYLKHIRDNELYLEDGYADINECAAAQLGYSQSTVSRFINICEKFSKDHNSPELDEKYSGFDKSQMIEMLPLEPEQLEKVTPDMTVKEIREVKKKDSKTKSREADEEEEATLPGQTSLEEDFPEYLPDPVEADTADQQEEKTEYATSHKLQDWSHYKQIADPGKASDGDTVIDGEYREVEEPEEVATSQAPELIKPDGRQQEYLDAFARYFISCKFDWMRKEFLNRVQDVTRSPKEIKAHLGSNSRWWYFKIGKAVASINLFNDYVQLRDENNCFMGNFDWFYLAAAIQRMWNVVSLERAKTMAKVEEEDSEEDDVSEPIDEIRRLRGILEQENKLLSEYLKLGDIPEPTVYRQKMIVGALANMVHEFESAEEKENAAVEMQQTELPELKNNDQRKEWLENYKEWGLWYRDENIDVNYYKYDFSDGSRLVVAEFPQRYAYWNGKKEDEAYYHLLEKNKKGYKKTYDEVYRNATDSETYLVDFLKNLQKGDQKS